MILSFNNKFYLQISGCAMGRKYSPAYADIYMAEWERTAFLKCTKLPLVYFRYLDDIFGLWTDTETAFLHNFLLTYNFLFFKWLHGKLDFFFFISTLSGIVTRCSKGSMWSDAVPSFETHFI